MCWSPAVTGLVLAFELACCGVLLARGERWFIFGMAPLIVQEAVSLALWREIAQDEKSGRSGCSQWNYELTFVLGVVVGGLVPLCFAVMTKRSIERWIDAVSHAVDLRSHIPGEFDEGRALTSTLDRTDCADSSKLRDFLAKERLHAQYAKKAIGGACCFVVLAMGYMASCAPLCTTRGPHGQQSWPFATLPPPALLVLLTSPLDRLTAWIVEHLVSAGAPASWLAVPIRAAHGSTWAQATFSLMWLLCYFGLLCVLVLYRGECARGSRHRRGRLAQSCVLGFGLGLVLLAGLVLGPNEGASVWCWGTSTAVAVMVVEPQVVHWAEPRGEAVRHLPAKARSNLDSLAHGLWLASRGPGRFVDNSFVDLTFE